MEIEAQLHFFLFRLFGICKIQQEREREKRARENFPCRTLYQRRKYHNILLSYYSHRHLVTSSIEIHIYIFSVVNFHLIIQINLLETPWTGIWNISKLHETMQPDSIHTNTKTKNQNSMRITKKSVRVAMLKDMNDYKSLIKPIYTNNICLDILIHCMQYL